MEKFKYKNKKHPEGKISIIADNKWMSRSILKKMLGEIEIPTNSKDWELVKPKTKKPK